jgi:hypothetical protein
VVAASGASEVVDELDHLRQSLVSAGVPDEVLQMLDGADDPGEVIARLVAAGVLPGPDDAFADLIAERHRASSSVRHTWYRPVLS